MLVKVCDICGEKIDMDNYTNLYGAYTRSIERYKNNHPYDLGNHDICKICAREYTLAQLIEIIRPSNV